MRRQSTALLLTALSLFLLPAGASPRAAAYLQIPADPLELPLAGEGPSRAAPAYGIVVMAHGGDRAWNEQVHAAVTEAGVDVPIRIAFGMADRASLARAIAELEQEGVRRIAVVRLFISGDSFLDQTRYLLGIDAAVPEFLFDSATVPGMRPVPDPGAVPPIAHGSDIVISRDGLADASLAGRILLARALGLSHEPERETVLVIAHGMGDEDSNDRLLRALEGRAALLREAAPFRAVEVATLREDWPNKRASAEQRIREVVTRGTGDGRVIVLPFRLAGFGPYAEVLDGLEYTADGTGLLPHPGLSDWIMRSAEELACRAGWSLDECDPEPSTASSS